MVVRGGFWVFALRATTRVVRFARTIVLARMLAPSDFGLLGIALLATSTLEAVSQTGFQSALIQNSDDAEDYLDTAWTVGVVRGIVLCATLWLAAPGVAAFFQTPAAAPIVRAIGGSVLLKGLSNIGVVYFQKDLEFHKQFVYELSGTAADLVVAVATALILRNVWALVLGLLAGNLVRLVMSYRIHPYRPRPGCEVETVASLISYGKWILLSSILILIGARGDDAVVGRVLGASVLGLYQMAYRISQLAVTEITYVAEQTAFPAYSKLQGELANLHKGYSRVAGLSATLSMPIAVAVVVLGTDFIQVFLGEKWLPMAPALAVLAVAALVKSIASTGSPLFKGSGNPRFEFEMQLVRAVTLVVAILPLSRSWGMVGAATAVVLSGLSMLGVWYANLTHRMGLAPKDVAGIFGPPLFSSAVMASSLILVRFLVGSLLPGTPAVRMGWFVLAMVVAAASYSAAVLLCQKLLPRHQVLRELARAIQG
jgi:O-antigen/teichoic acid export membrane protein